MKIFTNVEGQRESGGYSMTGMTLTGPLLLSGTVNLPAEAVHKQYVDNAASNIPATSVTTGTLAASRLPALSGDVVSSVGSSVVSLNTTGVVAGDYAKVTVSLDGRVTAGGSLAESDLPSFSWNKVTSDKPTTLGGYGITDALKAGTGTVTGFLTLAASPTNANELATKEYTDTTLGGLSNVATGDIVTRSTPDTPIGFLRLNGAELSKSTFNALYSVIGDRFSYIYNTPAGGGKPWQQQYQFNNSQISDVTGWKAGPSLPVALSAPSMIVTRNRVYLMGGFNHSSSNPISSVYTMSIDSNGLISAATTSTALPSAVSAAACFMTKNRVFLAGGIGTGTNRISTVYTAPINADGTLGAWTTTNSLPAVLSDSNAVVTNSRVYLIGGHTATAATNVVYVATINADGTIGTWSTTTNYPINASTMAAIVTKNRVYMAGGYVGPTTVNETAAVYTAPINADGTLGAWVAAASLPTGFSDTKVLVTKNRVFLFGGRINNNPTNVTYTAPINPDGTLGTWTTATNCPDPANQGVIVVTKNYVHLFGGWRIGSGSNSYNYAPIQGGVNDYSQFYEGMAPTTDPLKFRLPDYSNFENVDAYYFVKA